MCTLWFKMFIKVVLSCVLVSQVLCAVKKSYSELKGCDVGPLAAEIASYDGVVQDIIDYVTTGPFKGKTYDELVKFNSIFGSRPSGTKVLEDSIDYIKNLTEKEGIAVTTEDVQVPLWERGEETLTMLQPRKRKMKFLGIGFSVPTPGNGITAEIVVVSNFHQMNEQVENIKGKIVLFHLDFTTYEDLVKYKVHGASKAAEKGAVATLVRSFATFSIHSPYSSNVEYKENVTKIPTAAISIEDADFLKRLYDKGRKIVLHLKMLSKLDNNKISRNTLIDLKGRTNPEKLVIVAGHIDSCDILDGANDDTGGMFISWAVPIILKRLNLTSRRTIRTILYTGEEVGYLGALAYEAKHRQENENINFIMESDEGTYAPLGLEVAGSHTTRCIVAEVLKLFKSIKASTLIENNRPGTDITVLINKGVPGASFHSAKENYFWFHQIAEDSVNFDNRYEMDIGAAFWTAVAYVIAEITKDIHKPL